MILPGRPTAPPSAPFPSLHGHPLIFVPKLSLFTRTPPILRTETSPLYARRSLIFAPKHLLFTWALPNLRPDTSPLYARRSLIFAPKLPLLAVQQLPLSILTPSESLTCLFRVANLLLQASLAFPLSFDPFLRGRRPPLRTFVSFSTERAERFSHTNKTLILCRSSVCTEVSEKSL